MSRLLYVDKEEIPYPQAEKVNFDQLLESSDFIIICAALIESTRGIFNKAAFQKMKKTAMLINTARGPIVNMDDLADALEQGQIAGAGLDVAIPEPIPLDHRLLKLKNCVILPHIGSATVEARAAMSELAAQNVITALQNKSMIAEV